LLEGRNNLGVELRGSAAAQLFENDAAAFAYDPEVYPSATSATTTSSGPASCMK